MKSPRLMHWLALLPTLPEAAAGTRDADVRGMSQASMSSMHQRTLAWWALQFTPRVACLEEAVVLEVSGSLRLFGGASRLRERMQQQRLQGAAPAFRAWAWAPTSLGAMALARCVQSDPTTSSDGMNRPLPDVLDGLPLHALSAAEAQRATLERLGCRTLGDVRRLPRGGLARRFGADLMTAVDQAYGQQAEVHDWVTLPEVFDERLELPWRVETAPALMGAAQQLLQGLQAWLAARHAGVRAVVLRWQHDFGARSAGRGGELEVRTAQPVQRVEHLMRLMTEHLAQTTLLAPVGELALRATEIEPLPPDLPSLWMPGQERGDAASDGREDWQAVSERLSVRLGNQQVVRPVLLKDHRPGHMQAWEPVCPEQAARSAASQSSTASKGAVRTPAPRVPYNVPMPAWLLDEPQPLSMRQARPYYQGVLKLLAGPHRVESGWWDGDNVMMRDYFLAASPRAGLLWIYRTRLPQVQAARPTGRVDASGACWFLHGIYG